ncbi:MAG TPA: SDR family oxidoreductase [Spongiibacteraceae bacterium]|jgi:NAD(P)-dependent dehydrogenase (short-subunit alcohol dehydrogenase family)|nr:SDR family oxidoreductase [Spongiibacteraceae bacterium]HUH37746.1 SDR family oxidoreductase [Spongiibacteraceae bacterium]
MKDKVVIVTGAGTGIGAATAQRAAEEGAKVMLCGRRVEPLQEVVAAIRARGGVAEFQSTDIADENAVKALVAKTVETFGRIDSIVNNAVLMVPGMMASHDTKAWRQNFLVSLDGAMFLMREAYTQLEKNRGSVVNVSSVCALQGSVATGGYSAAKAALIAMSRNAAVEWGPKGVRVNVVVPGAFLTPPTEAVMPTEKEREATSASIALRRIGDPRECANAIVFLASDEAAYITGTTLVVDGGRTCELNTGTASWD